MTTANPGRSRRKAALVCAALALASAPQTGLAKPARPMVAGGHYVAMGSSFAAGPGVTQSADTPPTRCTRSSDNYAHQLARKHGLRLTDVSCGGATTAHITGPWDELPPQVDALTAETALVTITIGGNDVGYIGGLMKASCDSGGQGSAPATAVCKAMAARMVARSPQAPPQQLAAPTQDAWRTLGEGLDRIVREVRMRSPQARLVFIDYLSVLPAKGGCNLAPLSKTAAASARMTAHRLARETASAAKRAGADIIHASRLSKGHDACARHPWMTGFYPADAATPFIPYHPNLAGMSAIAQALDKRLSRRR